MKCGYTAFSKILNNNNNGELYEKRYSMDNRDSFFSIWTGDCNHNAVC